MDEHDQELRRAILDLAPWHMDIEVVPGLSTAISQEAGAPGPSPDHGPVGFNSGRSGLRRTIEALGPGYLEGKRMLDCACNGGGYLFWGKELGLREGYGFDAREHWIRQARFVQGHWGERARGLTFEVRNLYDLPALGLAPFDFTMFKGIFYHLPAPVSGLEIAADLTSDVLYLGTATWEAEDDDRLVVAAERPEYLMSGTHGLNWFPTGPGVLVRILRWLGFVELRLLRWRRALGPDGQRGRLDLLAAKRAGAFEHLDTCLDAEVL